MDGKGRILPPLGYELITEGNWKPGDKYFLKGSSHEWREDTGITEAKPIRIDNKEYLCARRIHKPEWEAVIGSLANSGIESINTERLIPTELEALRGIDWMKIPQGRISELVEEHGCETLGELKAKVTRHNKPKEWGEW